MIKITIKIMMGALFLVAGLAFAADSPLLARYGASYDREVLGDSAGAVTGYDALLAEAKGKDRALYAKLLYRTGCCERKLGRPETARRIWRELTESCPADDSFVVAARNALKLLDLELDRIVVEGMVTGPGSDTNAVPAVLFVGEWGSEPPVMTDQGGTFRAARKAAGRLSDGRRYGFIYAEHPVLPWVAAEGVAVDAVSAKATVRIKLGPAITLSGCVFDTSGHPVDGAMIRVTGFKGEFPLPFDRVIPPVVSHDGGQFSVPGLVPGWRYVLTAEKAGYRLKAGAEKDVTQFGAAVIPAGTITVIPAGEVSLRGRVVNEKGEGVPAKLIAWSPPPLVHQVGVVTADVDGYFHFRDIRENWVVLNVEGGAGLMPRSIPGVKPMGQEIDVILKASPGDAAGTAAAGMTVAMGSDGVSPVVTVTTQQLTRAVSSLSWLRGNPDTGGPFRLDDMKGRVGVYHFESVFRAVSLRGQYPREQGALERLASLYGDRGLTCVWILPEDEGSGEAARSALALTSEFPTAALASGTDPVWIRLFEQGGNVIVDRTGVIRAVCSDPQAFKAVKKVIGE